MSSEPPQLNAKPIFPSDSDENQENDCPKNIKINISKANLNKKPNGISKKSKKSKSSTGEDEREDLEHFSEPEVDTINTRRLKNDSNENEINGVRKSERNRKSYEKKNKIKMKKDHDLYDDDASSADENEQETKKSQKKYKKGTKSKTIKSSDEDSEDEQESSEASTSSSGSDIDSSPKKKTNYLSNKRKRRAKVSSSGSNDVDSHDDANEDKGLNKRKRNERYPKSKYRRIKNEHELQEATKDAAAAEKERRRRLEEKQKEFNSVVLETSIGETTLDGQTVETVKGVVLDKFTEKNADGKDVEHIIEIHPHIAQKLKPHQANGVRFMFDAVIERMSTLQKDVEQGKKEKENKNTITTEEKDCKSKEKKRRMINDSEEEEEDEDEDDGIKEATPGGTGCILAHSMGLGKTLQTIALVHTLNTNPHLKDFFTHVLIVCPKNVLNSWMTEFANWQHLDEETEGDFPEVEVMMIDPSLHPSIMNRVYSLRQWAEEGGALVMSYDTYRGFTASDDTKPTKKRGPSLQQQMKKKKQKLSKHQRQKQQNLEETRRIVTQMPDIVICDEGHLLKGENTIISNCMNLLKTKRRICLTGTPLQNRLDEYFTMVQFVRPNLLGTRQEFRNRFANPISNGQTKDASITDVRHMKKQTHVLFKLLESVVQRLDWFKALRNLPKNTLPPKFEYAVSCKLSATQVELYNAYMKNIFGDNDVEASLLKGRILYDSHIFNRIVTHPYLLEVHRREREEKDIRLQEKLDDDDFINDVISSEEVTEDSDGNIVEKDDNKSNKTYKEGDEDNAEDDDDGRETPVELRNNDWWMKSNMLKDVDEHDISLSGKLSILFAILQKCEKIGDKLLIFSQRVETLNYIQRFFNFFDRHRHQWFAGAHGKEALIASELDGQWGFRRGDDWDRIDGSTSNIDRSRIIDRFNEPDNLRMRTLIISTKAGGIGITLTAANRVVLFDVSWNPSIDLQSLFRVYRFGQEKPCYIYRLVAQGCMEERIYDRSTTKQATSLRCIDAEQPARHFTKADLDEMYRFEPIALNPNVLTERDRPKGAVPKDKLLADLMLDRTITEKEIDDDVSELKKQHETKKKSIANSDDDDDEDPFDKDDHIMNKIINTIKTAGDWVVASVAHDTLLTADEDEIGLSKQEQEQAWAEYESGRDQMLMRQEAIQARALLSAQRNEELMRNAITNNQQFAAFYNNLIQQQQQQQEKQQEFGRQLAQRLLEKKKHPLIASQFQSGIKDEPFETLVDPIVQAHLDMIKESDASQYGEFKRVIFEQCRSATDYNHWLRINEQLKEALGITSSLPSTSSL